MKKKLLVFIIFITTPIWIIPLTLWILVKESWIGISEFVDRRMK